MADLETGKHWVTCPDCSGSCGYDEELGEPTCTTCNKTGRVQAETGFCSDCHGSGVNSGVSFYGKPREVKILKGKRGGKDISGQKVTIGPGPVFETKGDCPTCDGKGYFGNLGDL